MTNLLQNEKNHKFFIERIKKLVLEAFPKWYVILILYIYSIIKNSHTFRNLYLFYFRENDENLQLDDDHIITTLKWAQNRILTLNDLVKEDLTFLWIFPSSMTNVNQTGCSGIIISLRTKGIDSICQNYITYYFRCD